MVNSDVMIEVKERGGIQRVKEAVKLRRFLKELANEESIALRGSRGQRLEGILNAADQVLLALEAEHSDWIEQKRQLFAGYLLSVKPSAVEEIYRDGLATTIVQEFRTYGRVNKDETVRLGEAEYLRDVITAYTFDFLRSLSLSKRLGINPNTALEIARLSYHYNPEKLTQLIRRYPDINLTAILRAALGYPKNPEAFLDGFISTIARLTKDPRYIALSGSAIERAALGYPKNPEAYLDKIKRGEELPVEPEVFLGIEEKLQDIPEDTIT